MSNEPKNILKFNNNKIDVNFQNIFVQNLVSEENNWTFCIDVFQACVHCAQLYSNKIKNSCIKWFKLSTCLEIGHDFSAFHSICDCN